MFAFWLLLAYISGALPWSVWLGELFFRTDPRAQADGNPGAANAFRAAGWRLGTSVLVLDFFKACLPVAIAFWKIGFPSGQLFWIALMPTIGHAFSVFLRFRGGRGIVVMFGVWTALTLYQAPLVMGATALLALLLFKKDDYRTLAIPVVLMVFLLLTGAAGWMIWLVVAQLLVLLLKIGAFYLRPPNPKRSVEAV
jgi:glycerol-3-phosphate acyltransferase PlsY